MQELVLFLQIIYYKVIESSSSRKINPAPSAKVAIKKSNTGLNPAKSYNVAASRCRSITVAGSLQ